MVDATLRPILIPHPAPRNDPVSIVQEAAWAPEPDRTGAENLASHRDFILDLQSVESRYFD